MTGSRFAFGHDQYLVFTLINAMIEAACKTVELSKLEGDAALFFVDSTKLTSAEDGPVRHGHICSFFQRTRAVDQIQYIVRAALHPDRQPGALKIFVHHGRASRFEFRGSIYQGVPA